MQKRFEACFGAPIKITLVATRRQSLWSSSQPDECPTAFTSATFPATASTMRRFIWPRVYTCGSGAATMGAKFEGGQLRAVKTPCQPIQEAVTECWIGVVGLLINANLDVNLEDCADLCLFCLVDIPMHKSRLESKHVLFSLYAELRASQHLRNMARDRDEADGATSVNIDQFVFLNRNFLGFCFGLTFF
ncbi:hypothetical protein niasHT_018713 [Heterodera trifolii]|uniref:Intraflagellar transport protein 46 homolog n=1 Tax=Heterodera trifolii TaxID=157864 RepID=A0ABD2LB97_9BILA